jgi:hypothetical protein
MGQDSTINQTIRVFLAVEAGSFIMAALVHFGVLTTGYEHQAAGTAESVIGVVLLAGLGATWLWPYLARTAGLAAQGFALLGTGVGLFTIAIGVGPRTVPDIVYHVCIVVLLIAGLRAARRGSAIPA